ncbi:MAG: hypothetical protein KZQ76_00405 [Candidatus Thiodiazotropha sp. (ex Epidulcina cf. delphinae)]|nr:hypothetical protein [Candidatus Thiodiazotropha sp. (ex Epidulcina cf. delphinae)]
MNDPIKQLIELVRKVDSKFYDPNIHGQGVVIAWNRKNNDWASGQGAFGKLFRRKILDYYFVKINSKPIQIKKVQFEWFEGTSDISLTLEANFQIKITSRQDAEKFVAALLMQRAVTVNKAFYQIIDEQLHNCMDRIYSSYTTQKKNLLDEFYLPGTQKGESRELDSEVTSGVKDVLSGLDFKIGFSLRNAPDRVADFSHCTILKKSPSQKEFNVQSECTLKLNSFQAYKKSGIKSLDDAVNQMKNAIDQAIHEYVSGKTLFDLFSNFDSTVEHGTKSISRLVLERVEAEAAAIGYELQAFYSLPDVAPLKLLNGIRIDINEKDGTFSTGYGGGTIKIHISMDVKAVHGGFEKLMHLLSPSGDYQDIDVLEFSYADLVRCIKNPIISICANVIKQKDYKNASTDFDNAVKKDLVAQLQNEMHTLYGLSIDIKSMFPVETEDSSRLRELSGRSKQFTFSVISNAAEEGELLVEFQSAYKVLGIDINSGWEAFEKTDLGYRCASPVRKQFTNANEETPDDRHCKSIAINNELEDIANEIIRYLKADLELIPGLFAWYRNAAANRTFQKKLLEEVISAIRQSRGLVVSIENITMDDRYLTKKATEERDTKYGHIAKVRASKDKLTLEQSEKSIIRQNALEEQVSKQKRSSITEIDDMDKLQQIEKQFDDPLEGVSQVPASISQALSLAAKGTEKPAYNEAIETLMSTKEEKPKNNQGEE